jgi:hypothetical protein
MKVALNVDAWRNTPAAHNLHPDCSQQSQCSAESLGSDAAPRAG